MKRTIFLFMLFSCLLVTMEGKIKIVTMVADFSGWNNDQVYTIHARTGFTSTVILPEKRAVLHVVCGDMASWSIECDGRFIFLKPMHRSLQTSLTVVTENGRVYLFNLVENGTGKQDYEVTAKVVISDKGDEVDIKPDVPSDRTEMPAPDQKNRQFLFNPQRAAHAKYRIKRNRFYVEQVYDDGIFTYLYMPFARIKPALFIKRGRGREPVKFVNQGDWIVVHGVIEGKEKLLLAVEDRITKISRRR